MENHDFLRVRNFERFQHYRDRRPPWIKLYRDLWNDPLFFVLSEVNRYFLMSFFVIASQNDNKIPNNQRWLQREMATTKVVPVEAFVQIGWLEWVANHASTTLADCEQDASKVLVLPRERDRSTETEGETEGEIPKPLLRVFGEFGWVKLTTEQHENLKVKLNSLADDYIARFDGWVQEAPEAKAHGVRRKDRDAYASMLNWYRKDIAEGKHGKQVETNSERLKRAGAEALKRFTH